MVLPREFSAVEQSKALSTFSCQVFCLCFSKLCPGGVWKANNLWVVLMEQYLRERKICFHYQNFAAYRLCRSVLQTWRHLLGEESPTWGWGRPGHPPVTQPAASRAPSRCRAGDGCVSRWLVERVPCQKYVWFSVFLLSSWWLFSFSLGGRCEGVLVPESPSLPTLAVRRQLEKPLFLSL